MCPETALEIFPVMYPFPDKRMSHHERIEDEVAQEHSCGEYEDGDQNEQNEKERSGKVHIFNFDSISISNELTQAKYNQAGASGTGYGILATMAVGVKYKSTKFEMINGAIMYLIFIGFLGYMVFVRGI